MGACKDETKEAARRQKIGEYWKNRKRGPQSQEHVSKLSAVRKGKTSPMKDKKHSVETRLKIADKVRRYFDEPGVREEWSRKNSGSNHPQWIEDRSKLKVTRNGVDPNALVHWRLAVFERDKYTCQECGCIGGKLNADHIKPLSIFPELALDLENGQTLCVPCHKKTKTYCGRVRTLTREDFI